MGRDEHNKSRGRNRLAQTPRNQLRNSDGHDVEYAEEFADHEDKEAQQRANAADKRAKHK
ncbi:YfhD family protein [Oceanobacillus halotolerans]|uniref:YfhD family protein n=1 Tax=Oceanobacillus halotolerans TaxID=2663380 RepID=UPI0013DB7299|nr:YfhD family protein [Oceanobacillus halotolerans]